MAPTAQRRGPASAKGREREAKQELKQQRKRDAKKAAVDDAAQLDDGPAFAQQLEPLGLVLVDIPGDGNCLFRALSDQLAGPKGSPDHRALRAALTAFIRTHRADFEPFCETEANETFDQYVQRLGRDGVYAGHWALVACARAYKSDVCIHQVGQPVWRIAAPDAAGPTALHVAYHGWEHYSSVRRRDGGPDGPAGIPASLVRDMDGNAAATAAAAAKARARADGGAAAAPWKMAALQNATGCTDEVQVRAALERHRGDVNAATEDLLAASAAVSALAEEEQEDAGAVAAAADAEAAQAVADDAEMDSVLRAIGLLRAASPPPPTPAAPAPAPTAKAGAGRGRGGVVGSKQRKEQSKKDKKERRLEEQRRQAAGAATDTAPTPSRASSTGTIHI